MKLFDPGRLRHRVLIQRLRSYEDAQNRVQQEWLDVTKVWSSIEPLSARESLMAQQLDSKVTTRVTMRYRSDVGASCRLIHKPVIDSNGNIVDGTIYDIRGVIPDPESGIEWMTLACETGANQG